LILIGMFDSPFVRRVAVSMNLLGIAFEHRNWSVGKDFELIRQFNPLGRVPTLVQPDGEALIESLHLNQNLNWESTVQNWPFDQPWQSARFLEGCATYLCWAASFRGE